jgi:uncharacterized damage-inducible protein DinB
MATYGGPELAKAFRTVRNNTIQIAKDIPEQQYSFVPATGWRSVGALLVHISQTSKLMEDVHRTKRLDTFQGYDFPAMIGRVLSEESKSRTKDEIISLLKTEGEDFASWLETLSPDFLAETFTDATGQNPRTRLEGLMSVKEHEMHHRGQLMLIERILGITPHLTRAMQERTARQQATATA